MPTNKTTEPASKAKDGGPLPAKPAPMSVPAAAHPPSSRGLQTVLVAIAVVTALYFGREVFVPIALAVLLTFLLSPMVSFLRRWRIPRSVAVVTVVSMAMFSMFVFGVVVANQLGVLAGNLPSYQFNLQNKIRDFQEMSMSGDTFDRAARMLESLEEQIQEAAEEETDPTEADAEPEPLPVRITEMEMGPLEMLQTVIVPLVAPLATAGIVIVFVIFMLLRREDLRDRFIRLVGSHDMHRTTTALQDAGRRVGQYLLMQLVVNVTYAVPVGVGLWLIGVPNALLWGLLALVLRFVPYVGPIIAAFFPLALSIAVDPGWTMLLWTVALLVTLELISSNIIEPVLYGSRTGLSPVAIILAAIFWTWLWGPIGLLLSTPLTVCFVVLGRHVPQFEFLDILLGNQPVLSPHERLYQRLLAGDPDEATELAELYLKEHSIVSFYDDVAVPALALVELDRVRGVLDERQREIVATGALELVENLDEHEDDQEIVEEEEAAAAAEAEADRTNRPRGTLRRIHDDGKTREGTVICAGGRGNLDDAAAIMLADALLHIDADATAMPHEMLQPAQLRTVEFSKAATIVVGYLNNESMAHARYLVRRLRRSKPDLNIYVAFWSLDDSKGERAKMVEAIRCDAIVTSIDEVIGMLQTEAVEEPRKKTEDAGEGTAKRTAAAAPA